MNKIEELQKLVTKRFYEESNADKRQALYYVLSEIEKLMHAPFLMPFGKHKNKNIKDVPEGYLAWCWQQEDGGNFDEIKNWIRQNKLEIVLAAVQDQMAYEDAAYDYPWDLGCK